jgi:hypothetical protein
MSYEFLYAHRSSFKPTAFNSTTKHKTQTPHQEYSRKNVYQYEENVR